MTKKIKAVDNNKKDKNKKIRKHQNTEYLERMDNLVRLFKGENVVNKSDE